MIIKLKPVDEVIAKIIDDLGLGDRDIPFESMVDWIYHGLKVIGAYTQYESKKVRLKIEDYSAQLPHDFYRVDAAKFTEPHKITFSTITVGFRAGSIELDYLSMPVDDRGYPFVPDTPEYDDAFLYLVASKLALRGELLLDKRYDYEYWHQKWVQKSLEARTEADMGDIQFIQRRVNDYTKRVYSVNPLRDKFKDLGRQQKDRIG